MVGSMDYLDFCAEIPITEKNTIPLDCWHDITLSNIWIPSQLLPNRSKPGKTRVTQGIYHTLEKKDASKYSKSFSVYSYSDIESEQEEIYISESDEDIFGSDSTNFKIETSDNTLPTKADDMCLQNNACSKDLRNTETNILNKNSERRDNGNLNPKENLIVNRTSSDYDEVYQVENVEKIISSGENLMNNRENLAKDGRVCVKSISKSDNTGSQMSFAVCKKFHEVETSDIEHGIVQTSKRVEKNTDSVISLKDILDDTSMININDFAFDYKKGDNTALLCAYDKKEKKIKKNKKDKVKKKSSKYMTLDKFLEGSVDASQDYYCDKYFQSILNEKYKNGCFSNVPLGSNAEFPELAVEEYKFIHSDKTIKENVKMGFDNLKCDLSKSGEINKNETVVEEIKSSLTDMKYGKIIIENIPADVTKDDISLILCGYGEIKNLSLVSAGNFISAYVEIDLICDIDWIIECLNGSEPFGDSTEKLHCYKQ